MGEDIKAGADSAALGVVGAVDKARDTGLDDGARAHAAGLDSDVQRGASKAAVGEPACCFSQNDNLRVSGWVVVADGAVARASEDLAVVDKHGADGDFAGCRCGARFSEGFLHELGVGFHVPRENNMRREEKRNPRLYLVGERGPNTDNGADGVERQKPLLDNWGGGKQTRRMRELLERLFQVDFLKGLAVTFRAQHPKNIVTEQYPLERPMVAERYRGAPRLNNNPETGETLCIGCNLCALACPENLIVVGWQRDDATRRKVLTNFTYDTSRCMFCGLCEDACPVDALELTQDFEMAYFTREGAIWDRHRLEQGPTPARYTR